MKPILFNTEMVRAILDGRKTVTRRIIKFPDGLIGSHSVGEAGNPDNPLGLMWACGIKRPLYQLDDILYVRETWNTNPLHDFGDEPNEYVYKADYDGHAGEFGWRPSIHMPRKAARIFLWVTDVRVERLQDITDEQAKREGYKKHVVFGLIWTARDWFIEAWDDVIKPPDRALYGWEANPWVWVIEFERISKEEAK